MPPKPTDSMAELKMCSGTGFFIRKANRLFLLTSKHVLSGCDKTDKNPYYPNEMGMWVSNDSIPKILRLNVKKIKDTSSCLPLTLSPDIIVVEIKDTITRNVYSVEKFICPRYKKINNAVIIGYPGIGGVMAGLGLEHRSPLKIKLEKNAYSLEGSYTDATMTKRDSINYYIFSKTQDFKDNLRGISGSPFFVQDRKSKKWRIAGIAVGNAVTNKNKYGLMAANIDFAIAEID